MIRPRLRTQNGMGMGQNLSPMGPQILVYIYIFCMHHQKVTRILGYTILTYTHSIFQELQNPSYAPLPEIACLICTSRFSSRTRGSRAKFFRSLQILHIFIYFLLIPPVVTRGWLENGWEWRIYYGFLTAFPIQPCLWSAIFHCHVWLPNGTHSRTPRMNRFLTSHRWLLQPNRLGNADTLVYVVFWRTYDGRTPTEKIPFCCELTALPCPKSEEYPQKRSSPWDAIKHWFTPIKTKLKVLGIVIPKAKLENKRFKPPTMPFMGQSLL